MSTDAVNRSERRLHIDSSAQRPPFPLWKRCLEAVRAFFAGIAQWFSNLFACFRPSRSDALSAQRGDEQLRIPEQNSTRLAHRKIEQAAASPATGAAHAPEAENPFLRMAQQGQYPCLSLFLTEADGVSQPFTTQFLQNNGGIQANDLKKQCTIVRYTNQDSQKKFALFIFEFAQNALRTQSMTNQSVGLTERECFNKVIQFSKTTSSGNPTPLWLQIMLQETFKWIQS